MPSSDLVIGSLEVGAEKLENVREMLLRRVEKEAVRLDLSDREDDGVRFCGDARREGGREADEDREGERFGVELLLPTLRPSRSSSVSGSTIVGGNNGWSVNVSKLCGLDPTCGPLLASALRLISGVEGKLQEMPDALSERSSDGIDSLDVDRDTPRASSSMLDPN